MLKMSRKKLVHDKRSSLIHLAAMDEEKKHIFITLTLEECGAGRAPSGTKTEPGRRGGHRTPTFGN
jgi:hypothetical protein